MSCPTGHLMGLLPKEGALVSSDWPASRPLVAAAPAGCELKHGRIWIDRPAAPSRNMIRLTKAALVLYYAGLLPGRVAAWIAGVTADSMQAHLDWPEQCR